MTNANTDIGLSYRQMRATLRRQNDLLRSLFDGAFQAQTDAEIHGRSLSQPRSPETGVLGKVIVSDLVLKIERLATAAEVRNIYAGTVLDVLFVLTSGLVDAYRATGATDANDVGPKIGGVVFWRHIRSGRHNHHHWQDWGRTRLPEPTKPNYKEIQKALRTQKRHVEVLSALLGFDVPDPFEENPIGLDLALEVLRNLGPNYDDVESLVRQQALAIIERLGLQDSTYVVFAFAENGGP